LERVANSEQAVAPRNFQRWIAMLRGLSLSRHGLLLLRFLDGRFGCKRWSASRNASRSLGRRYRNWLFQHQNDGHDRGYKSCNADDAVQLQFHESSRTVSPKQTGPALS
jgi:hypothetical protein